MPKGIRRVSANEWRKEFGKLLSPPETNFAGRFHISLNSCGTGCRYYTLTDLSNGKDLKTLAPFASGESPSKTREGYSYTTDLFSRPNSNLLIAQYSVDTPSGEQCRERSFLWVEDKFLRPISNTKIGCRNQ